MGLPAPAEGAGLWGSGLAAAAQGRAGAPTAFLK